MQIDSRGEFGSMEPTEHSSSYPLKPISRTPSLDKVSPNLSSFMIFIVYASTRKHARNILRSNLKHFSDFFNAPG